MIARRECGLETGEFRSAAGARQAAPSIRPRRERCGQVVRRERQDLREPAIDLDEPAAAQEEDAGNGQREKVAHAGRRGVRSRESLPAEAPFPNDHRYHPTATLVALWSKTLP